MLRPQTLRTRPAWFAIAVIALTAAVFSTGCQRDATPSSQDAPSSAATMRTVTVPVNGMICMVCAGVVKNTLQAVHGVRNAEVDLAQRNVTVHYEDGVSVDELTRAINNLGYKAGVPVLAQAQ